jgi:hypothetical protein
MKTRAFHLLAASLLLLLSAGGAEAAQPVYKCGGRNGVTYTHVPCSGAREVDPSKKRTASRNATPPQDRAKIARRAQLSKEDRQECTGLDRTLKEQEAFVKAKGSALTDDDERPLVKAKLRYRELRC